MDALIARLDEGDACWRAGGRRSACCMPRRRCASGTTRWSAPTAVSRASVHVAEMAENLGYAGGINAWLRPLLAAPEWEAVWVLNPDTLPEPDALAELAAYARLHGKGMVGSCIIKTDRPDRVFTRGLTWNGFICRTEAIDTGADVSIEPDPKEIEARLDIAIWRFDLRHEEAD